LKTPFEHEIAMVLLGIAPSVQVNANKELAPYVVNSILTNPMKTFDKQ
jgi:hypothetical protein